MCFHVAVKILSSNKLCYRYNTSCKELLRHFIRESPKLYGGHFVTYNIQCLFHLPDEVLRFGSIDSFSDFPFEIFLYELKKLIRHCRNPLVQSSKRLVEISNGCGTPAYQRQSLFSHPPLLLSRPHSNGVLLNNGRSSDFWQFQSSQFRNWKLSINPPNCFITLSDQFDSVVTIENFIVYGEGSVYIVGHPFNCQDSFYFFAF